MSRYDGEGGMVDMEEPGVHEARRAESATSGGLALPERVGWLGGWLAILVIPLWIGRLSPVALAVGGACTLLWALAGGRGGWRSRALPAALLALTLGIAGGVQLRLAEIAGDWPRLETEVEERAASALNRELDALVERGETAVAALENELGGRAPAAADAALFARLEQIRRSSSVEALALYDANGVTVAWSGEHRGMVPLAARHGEMSYIYEPGPLFEYLYFVRRLPGGQSAVAAMLLEAQVAVGEGTVPFAERFSRRHGLRPRFSSPERARGPNIWDWSTDRPILSVSFATLTQQHWWERVVERGRRSGATAWLAALAALSALWYRRSTGYPGLPVAVATAGTLLLPLEEIFATGPLFSPLLFVLPGRLDVTLGMLLILLFGVAVWLLTRTGPLGRFSLPLPLTVALAAAGIPAILTIVDRSAAGGLLAGAAGGGFALQLATTLLLALLLYLLLSAQPARDPERGSVRLAVATGLAIGMAAALVLLWDPAQPPRLWVSAAWAIPFAAMAGAGSRQPRHRRALRNWTLATLLAASVALPHLYVMHVRAELASAEGELARLGTETDPFLNFLLRQFAERATAYDAIGEDGVNLLYHSWVASGLAREGYEARLNIWRDGAPETELRLSQAAAPPLEFGPALQEVAGAAEPLVRRFTDREGLHYLLLVPLRDGRIASVAVPPRFRIGRSTALARYLYPRTGLPRTAAHETLYLVPISPEEREEVAAGALNPREIGIEWERTASGWRSEARANFPDGWMHAHLLVHTTPFPLLTVRAILLAVGLLAISAALWLVGRLLCGETPMLAPLRRRWLRSLRGRLTLALLVFFLTPMAIFGAVAYGAVVREVVRSAGALAQRALEQAAREVPRSTLTEVGDLVDTDLLLFRRGALVGAAAPEVLDLGIFHTWLPPSVFLGFAGGEDLEEREERRLGGNEYLIAYRRLNPSVVLAAPVPLASDEITRRQREFAHIALLMSLLGAAFSVFLSVQVGRALTRPLDELGRAVATVGTGNLRVRLPESRTDEFGSVYAAFNRMVRRIRRARMALVRETRRTETIVAEAATGVLALDPQGHVELVNPHASEILGTPLAIGSGLPRETPLLHAVAGAVDRFWTSNDAEASQEIEVEGRIVRLRLRRLRGPAEERGAVVALEDVTAEVRTARVLAWGEMARQVAHEIKNPLTPIKLSVQHLQRAFTDRRADFDRILERNVEAILREIDRLSEISRAFARFGTPQQAEEAPYPVDLVRVVHEVLVLYRGADDALSYSVEVEATPPVHVIARDGELREVLVNLLENAREATAGSGEIRFRVLQDAPGGVELRLSDTGEGIDPELLDTIFEPHFSTRTSGTGLGLAIVRRMVDSWGAEIAAESAPGHGTTFSIRFRAAVPGPVSG